MFVNTLTQTLESFIGKFKVRLERPAWRRRILHHASAVHLHMDVRTNGITRVFERSEPFQPVKAQTTNVQNLFLREGNLAPVVSRVNVADSVRNRLHRLYTVRAKGQKVRYFASINNLLSVKVAFCEHPANCHLPELKRRLPMIRPYRDQAMNRIFYVQNVLFAVFAVERDGKHSDGGRKQAHARPNGRNRHSVSVRNRPEKALRALQFAQKRLLNLVRCARNPARTCRLRSAENEFFDTLRGQKGQIRASRGHAFPALCRRKPLLAPVFLLSQLLKETLRALPRRQFSG